MTSTTAQSPVSRHKESGGLSLVVATSLLGVLALLRVLPPLTLPFPVCVFRELTHLPCPLCGGTRALISLSHGDVIGALALNPLVAAAAVITLIWPLVIAIPGTFAARNRARNLLARRSVLVPLFVGHWSYLMLQRILSRLG